jgi:hypothetical protein
MIPLEPSTASRFLDVDQLLRIRIGDRPDQHVLVAVAARDESDRQVLYAAEDPDMFGDRFGLGTEIGEHFA